MKILLLALLISGTLQANTICTLTELDPHANPASLKTQLEVYDSPATGKQLRTEGQMFQNISVVAYKTKSGLIKISVEKNNPQEFIGAASGLNEVTFESSVERHNKSGQYIFVSCKEE